MYICPVCGQRRFRRLCSTISLTVPVAAVKCTKVSKWAMDDRSLLWHNAGTHPSMGTELNRRLYCERRAIPANIRVRLKACLQNKPRRRAGVIGVASEGVVTTREAPKKLVTAMYNQALTDRHA
ncbi:uncharacterized protein B0H18DRAFT_971423 [Fomitopsis serialis]|uniref:uncharacterized protein n=1 Tax=Fomitopsis serialis TaxID=139415 RepID=UPI002007579F|nr:uncharacterized protein B0H18DRAFT_971423 [Neoantrodia serialis]KAH9937608.1 hypothetical protein B0H18DRAFT_971423 [Neoantrodia serialis]